MKACSLDKSNPRVTFSLRIYASAFLTHTSVDPDAFWDQILKFSGAFVKSQTVADDKAIQVVLSSFSDVATSAENREGENRA